MISWPQLVIGFLGGGVVAGLIGLIGAAAREQKARRTAYLQRQLDELYGPLEFLASSSQGLFDFAKRLNDAYREEYIEKEYSKSPEVQANVRAAADLTIGIENEFIGLAAHNSDAAAETLKEHYSLIDSEDADVFGQFLVHVARRRVEPDSTGKLRTPFEILLHVGVFSFMPEEFIDAVGRRFAQKRAELVELMK